MSIRRLAVGVKDFWDRSPWLISAALLVVFIAVSWITSGGGILQLNAGMVSLAHDVLGENKLMDTSRILTHYMQRNPENEIAWLEMGYFFLVGGDEEQAVEAWEKAEIAPRDLIIKGEYERRSGRTAEAFKWYSLAGQLDPDSGDASFFLGWMYLLDDNPGLAWEYLQRSGQLPRELITDSDLYYQLGKVINRLGISEQRPHALDYFTWAIYADEFSYPYQEADAHFQRAMVYRQNGWNDLAFGDLEYAVKVYPSHYSSWVRLGYIAWEVQEDLELAEGYFSQAISLNPKGLPAYLGLAKALDEAGERTRAKVFYEQILLIDPMNQTALDWINVSEQW